MNVNKDGKTNVASACRSLDEAHSRMAPIQTSGRRYANRVQDLRSTLIDDEPWFVASDVCRALGLDVTRRGANSYTARLGNDRRVVGPAETPHLFAGKRGYPRLTVVNEAGLYRLILRSDKATAKPFQDWVTREALPSIRKTGGYLLADHGRTEMPLPADFAAAPHEMTRAQVQLAERVAIAMEELKAIFAQSNPPKLDERMRTAKQLLAMGVASGMASAALGLWPTAEARASPLSGRRRGRRGRRPIVRGIGPRVAAPNWSGRRRRWRGVFGHVKSDEEASRAGREATPSGCR